MPYGVPNEKPEQTRWMERCVSSVMKQNKGYDESRAIAICKAQLKKNGWKVKKSEDGSDDVNIDPDTESGIRTDGQYRRITWGPRTI